MPNVGPLELVVIAIVALLVLGPARLPEAARAAGRGMREFKNAFSGSDDEDELAEKTERSPS